jgi:hypothetical protein
MGDGGSIFAGLTGLNIPNGLRTTRPPYRQDKAHEKADRQRPEHYILNDLVSRCVKETEIPYDDTE